MRRVALSLLLIGPASAQVNWRHLSSRHGDLPVPNGGRQQTASLAADLDLDIVSLGWSHARVLLYENKAIDRRRAPR
ncbi:MAG: hypothetical protein ACRD44_10380 [Bryobacteraceae bacterium]